MRNCSIFHILLLNRYPLPVRGQSFSERHPVVVKETDEWEVDCIFDSWQHYQKLHYVIKLAGDNYMCMSWESADHLKNTRDLVEYAHREYPDLLSG